MREEKWSETGREERWREKNEVLARWWGSTLVAVNNALIRKKIQEEQKTNTDSRVCSDIVLIDI